MVYLSIDTKTKQAELLLEYLKTLPFVTVHQEPNPVTKKAMAEAKKGKTQKHKSAADLVGHLNN